MTFHVNNFILLYAACLTEKNSRDRPDDKYVEELTSLMMRPALIEGTESGVLFTLMLGFPVHIEWCILMAGLMTFGIFQRTSWIVSFLS